MSSISRCLHWKCSLLYVKWWSNTNETWLHFNMSIGQEKNKMIWNVTSEMWGRESSKAYTEKKATKHLKKRIIKKPFGHVSLALISLLFSFRISPYLCHAIQLSFSFHIFHLLQFVMQMMAFIKSSAPCVRQFGCSFFFPRVRLSCSLLCFML